MNSNSPTSNHHELFEVEGYLEEKDALYLEMASGLPTPKRDAYGEVIAPFRAPSHLSIGYPIVLPLAPGIRNNKKKVPEDILLLTQKYDFYQVQLACSFQSAPHSRFSDARFALTLQTDYPNDNVSSMDTQEKAIAYDLFPLVVEDECKVSVKSSLKPEVKFSFNQTDLSLSVPEFSRTEEYISYTSRIEAFGLQGTQPAWNFTYTHAHEISGSYKLLMIVRKPKGAQVQVTFNLAARVQAMIGKVVDPFNLILLFRRKGASTPLTDSPSIPLC